MKAIEIHNALVLEISKIKGVENIKEIFESLNIYGHTTSEISFRFAVSGEFNFSSGSISIDYKNQLVFIPDIGPKIIKGLSILEMINALKKRYKKL